MSLRVLKRVLSVFFVCAFTLPVFAQTPQDKSDVLAKKYGTELDCSATSQDPIRSWCPVALLNQFPFKTVTAPKSLIGLSMRLKDTDSVKEKTMTTTALAILHLTPTTVRLTDLTPSNEGEKQELLKVAFDLATILKGIDKSGQLKVSSGLLSFVQSESKKAGHAFAAQKNSVSYAATLPSGLYYVEDPRVGPVYIAIEVASDGTVVNIFPTVALASL